MNNPPAAASPKSRLVISIIIPTYRRPARLAACLESIQQVHYPAEQYEVIVVNDGGEIKAIDDLLGQQGANVRVIHQENQGPAAARNKGAAAAGGEFLAFLDDDCRPAPAWLARLAEQLQQAPACLVGGHTINALTGNMYASASQLLIDYLYDYFNGRAAGPIFFTSNNFALAREQFLIFQGFDTSFPLAAGEDREFCDRWRRQGREMVYVPTAVIYHAHQLGLRSFWRQHFDYGRGAWHFHQLRSRQQAGQIEVEPLKFYWQLVRYPLKKVAGRRKWLLMLLMGVTQVANALGFFTARWSPARARQKSG